MTSTCTLKIKDEVETVIGFFDIPPYVTIVPPCLERRILWSQKEQYKTINYFLVKHNQVSLQEFKNQRSSISTNTVKP